jgi:hypothetical protein
VRQAPLRLQLVHHELERQFLMRVGPERGLPHPADQVGKAGIAGELPPQRQHVDEAPDQAFDLEAAAGGHRHAHDQVLLPGQARQQRLEAGEQQHEQGGPALALQRPQGGQRRRRQAERQPRPAEPLRRRPRPVQRQREQPGSACQVLPPVGEMGREHLSLQPLALPAREIGVLNRQLRQRRGAPRRESGVQGGELGGEHAQRPAVGHDVVQGREQDGLPAAQQHELHPHQRPSGEVERPHAKVGGEPLDLRLPGGGGQPREVEPRRRQSGGLELRDRAAIDRREGRAQRLVPAHDLGQGRDQRRLVQVPGQAQCQRHVVRRLAWRDLIDEPEALLGIREHCIGLAGRGPDRRRLGAAGPQRRRNRPRQTGRVRGGEQLTQRHLDAKLGADARQQANRRQGVAAEIEEVVLRGDCRNAEQLLPDAPELQLDLAGQRASRRGGAHPRRRGQGPPVDLAAGGPRQLGKDHEVGGHHVVRQAPPQRRAPGALEAGAGQVCHQARASRRVGPGDHHRLAHPGLLAQRRLDLAELDAETAQLDLMVDAAKELQLAVRQPARQVSGAVAAFTRRRGGGVRDEALGGRLRASQVAAGEAAAAQQQLPGHADRHRLAAGVQQLNPGAGDRPADRRRRVAARQPRHRGPDRALGGAVGIDQAAACRPACRQLGRARLAPDHQGAQRRQRLGRQQRQGGGRQQRGADRLPGEQPQQARPGHQLVVAAEDQGGP